MRARSRKAFRASKGKRALSSRSERGWIFCTSWEVRNPSMAWRKGRLAFRAATWAMAARSWAACTDSETRIPNPVGRTA